MSKNDFVCKVHRILRGRDVRERISDGSPRDKEKECNMNKKKFIWLTRRVVMKIAVAAALAVAVQGCYISKAEIKAEGVEVKPFWASVQEAPQEAETPSVMASVMTK